jgi:Glycosyl hydrolase family 12
MRRLKVVLLLMITLSAVMGPTFALASPKAQGAAAKKFTLCRSHAVVTVTGQGRGYLVKNDNFAGRAECLSGSYTAPAFRVSLSRATSTGPGPDASPIIYTGCSWGSCSPRTWLPARVSTLRNPLASWQTTENAKGAWSAAYDVWFNPRRIRDGQAASEMMIWLNAKGLYSPQGHGWPVVRLAGALWYVLTWETGIGTCSTSRLDSRSGATAPDWPRRRSRRSPEISGSCV